MKNRLPMISQVRNARLLQNKNFDMFDNQMGELQYNQFIRMW